MKKFYLYNFICPITNKVFYVGKGTGNRINHNGSRQEKLNRKIKSIKAKGGTVIRRKVQYFDTEKEAYKEEIKLIEIMRKKYGKFLCNIADGGEGASSGSHHHQFGKKLSEKTKNKISNTLKGKMIGINNPFYGKTHTAKTKQIISNKNKGRLMGNKNPMKNKEILKKHKERLNDPEVKKRHISGLKKAMNKPETKRKLKRRSCGTNNPAAKLNYEAAEKIRELFNTGRFLQKEIAKKFNVGQTTISKIVRNKVWTKRIIK